MRKKIFKNLQTFSEYFGVSKQDVEKFGFYDINLSTDSDLYIDSKLLTDDNSPYFLNAASTLKREFNNIVVLLKKARERNKKDMYWDAACKRMTFKELHGLCLGYGTNDVIGNGVGTVLRNTIMDRLWQLIKDGRDSPELLDLINVFTEGFGCDRSSDLVAYFIRNIIYDYNERIIKELNLSSHPMILVEKTHNLLQHPFKSKLPILLVPKSILSKLPVCFSLFEIENAMFKNEEARENLQSYIPLKENITKDDIFHALLSNKTFYEKFIETYKKEEGKVYNFDEDPKCVCKFIEIAKESYYKNPDIYLENSGLVPTNVCSIVDFCLKTFKHLVEDRGIRNSVRKYDEKVSQHIFAATSYIYCNEQHIEMCPEMNSGRGPIDFFFTNGKEKVSVEIKKLSSNSYLHGLEKQLPDYMKSNDSQKGIYVVLNDVSRDTKKVQKLYSLYSSLDGSIKETIDILIIDAYSIPSASHL